MPIVFLERGFAKFLPMVESKRNFFSKNLSVNRRKTMSTTVIKVSQKTIAEMMKDYHHALLNKKVPYTVFVAKKGQTTITAYTSGKVMFQGDRAEAEAARWSDAAVAQNSAASSSKAASSSLPAGFSQLSVVGSDEVGNGSYFGPLVVCAVYASKEQLPALKALGVKDSKMLTDPQIRAMAPKIEKLVPYQLLTVDPTKYNQIQPKYNTVRMKVAVHNQAIRLLLQKIAPETPDAILIDQFTSEKNYRNYLKSEKNQVTEKLFFATKGEQYHLAVAAASILCRTVFLDELEKASQEVGVQLPSGAGSKSDQVAARLLQKGGLPLLAKYAKLHFANTEKAQKIAGYPQ
jgi:ribonuclease HIII